MEAQISKVYRIIKDWNSHSEITEYQLKELSEDIFYLLSTYVLQYHNSMIEKLLYGQQDPKIILTDWDKNFFRNIIDESPRKFIQLLVASNIIDLTILAKKMSKFMFDQYDKYDILVKSIESLKYLAEGEEKPNFLAKGDGYQIYPKWFIQSGTEEICIYDSILESQSQNKKRKLNNS